MPVGGPETRPPAPAVLRGCLLAVVVAVAVALPYLLLVPYAAPRFLLPTHALLAPAAALGVLALVGAARASRRPWVGLAALGLVLAGHLAVQLPLVHGNVGIQAGARGDWARIADVLHDHGVGGGGAGTGGTPCVLRGNASVIPIAYVAGCAPAEPDDPRRPAALVLREAGPPHWARSWPRHPVPGTYASGWAVHVRP